MEMNQTAAVADWVANLSWSDIPPEAIRQAKRCLRDHLGCVAGGVRSTPGRIAAQMAAHWGGPPEASIVGAEKRVAARHAAFANATLANSLDFDDTLYGHPGATTFPATLAAAEKWGADGKSFLMASLVGYELSVRAMALLEPIIPRWRAMWDLGTLQAYGAAAAAAHLARLPASGIANVLGLISATARVPHPRKERQPGEGRSMLKSAYGWAVDSAIVAVEMTLAGFAGPARALDGNMGFWKLTPSAALGVENFVDKLGERWAIMDVEFKPYMACRFLHPVLEGIETLLQRRPFAAEAVELIDVRSYSLLTDEYHYILRPASGIDAQFSVPYVVAAMLQGNGELSPESYNEQSLSDADLLALAERVSVDVDAGYEAAFPDRLGASVRVQLRDGFSDQVSVDNALGAPDHPISEVTLHSKFEALVEPLVGLAGARALAQQVDELETLDHLDPLTRLLRQPSAAAEAHS
jgi:2-methylcitrate dehydratase PrpD